MLMIIDALFIIKRHIKENRMMLKARLKNAITTFFISVALGLLLVGALAFCGIVLPRIVEGSYSLFQWFTEFSTPAQMVIIVISISVLCATFAVFVRPTDPENPNYPPFAAMAEDLLNKVKSGEITLKHEDDQHE